MPEVMASAAATMDGMPATECDNHTGPRPRAEVTSPGENGDALSRYACLSRNDRPQPKQHSTAPSISNVDAQPCDPGTSCQALVPQTALPFAGTGTNALVQRAVYATRCLTPQSPF
jgi:hypothetical protein